MSVGVIGRVVLPAVRNDVEPCPGEDSYGMGVVVAAGDGTVVEVGGPWVGVSGVAGEVSDGVAELFVACPAEADGAGLARLSSRGCNSGEAGQRFWCGEAGAAVADFGEQSCGAVAAGAGQAGEDVRSAWARGRDRKMCASACRVSCSSIGTDKALICSLTVRSTVKSARVTWVSAAPSSPMAPRGAEVRRAWRTARSVRPQ